MFEHWKRPVLIWGVRASDQWVRSSILAVTYKIRENIAKHIQQAYKRNCLKSQVLRSLLFLMVYSVIVNSILAYSDMVYSVLANSVLAYSVLVYSILAYSVLVYSILAYSGTVFSKL